MKGKIGERVMLYATGDTHGDFQRFQTEIFRSKGVWAKTIMSSSAVIWRGMGRCSDEQRRLDWLEARPFTTLFVSGNHENFELLAKYPAEEWCGGKVHRIRPHVIHLMRGQVFDIEGYTFFTMGGAKSHDISDGILDTAAPDFEERYWAMRRKRATFRVNHYSRWQQEMPSEEEYEEARQNLEHNHWEVDYIITHCAPSSIVDTMSHGHYDHDALTDFLEEVRHRSKFHYWLFGHYHSNGIIEDKFVLLYEQIVRVV